MDIQCLICRKTTIKKKKLSRSDSFINFNYCKNCDFLFSQVNKSKSLSNNNLDKTRLLDAGLKIPSLDDDFKNGLEQSKDYYQEYLGKSFKPLKILEIGCSWGYFLDFARSKGHFVTGLEINQIRKKYINENLGILCFGDIDELIRNNKKFNKIFLFYVIEYINDPVDYLNKLFNLLKKDGEIYIITPNKNDAIEQLWDNKAYKKFNIDDHVVNYFSLKSCKELTKKIKNAKVNIISKQGYSFFNHLKWYFTNKPSTTGIVGGDNFTKDLADLFYKSSTDSENIELKLQMGNMINSIDSEYKKYLEKNNLGNQIVMTLRKINR